MNFRSTVSLGGKTATGIEVPPEVVEALGKGKKPPVRVTVGAHTYRSTIALRGGLFMIPLSADNRSKAGVAAGDEVDVEIELDTAPREVNLAPDIVKALDADAAAKSAFEALSYSNKRGHIDLIEGAKTAETRARRITKVIHTLQGRYN
jgi:hypothetical protein